jgi:hypothetical protein
MSSGFRPKWRVIFNCYTAILAYALMEVGLGDTVRSIPAVQVFLELGASDRTMVSLMELGLSRVVAFRLNEISSNKNMDMEEARHWLASRPIENFGLSRLLQNEVWTCPDLVERLSLCDGHLGLE